MSQFTAIPAYNPPAPAKSFNGSAATEKRRDDFADILDTLTDPVEEAEEHSPPVTEQADAAPKEPAPPAEPAPEAEPAATETGIDPALDAALRPSASEIRGDVPDVLVSIVDGLNKLQTSIQNGEEPDPKLVKRLGLIINALAGLVGFKLDQVPTAAELTAMAAQPPAQGDPVQSQLQKLLAPLTQTLIAKTDQPELATLGGKLGAMLKALGETSPEMATALEPEIQHAVSKLLTSAPVAPTAPETPATAIPPAAPEGAPAADAGGKLPPPTLSVEAAAGTDSDTDANALTGGVNAKDRAHDAKPDLAANIAATTAQAGPDAPSAVQNGAQQQAKVDAAVVAPRPVMPGYQTSQQQLNLPQLAFELARQTHDGNTRFQMRLDPAELGRIDVKLDIDANGQVNARLTVEKAETLDLMQRDQRALEKALQQAGLDGAKTNLEFSLKQNPFSQGQPGQDGQGRPSLFGDLQGGADADEASVPTVNLYRGNLSASGVNILA